jgi:hypothetical protein
VVNSLALDAGVKSLSALRSSSVRPVSSETTLMPQNERWTSGCESSFSTVLASRICRAFAARDRGFSLKPEEPEGED